MAVLYWTDEDTGELDAVRFDATTSEDPTDAVTITDHPVEEGANVVDHARDEPERITIEGIITNTPHAGNLTEDDDNAEAALGLSPRAMGAPGTQTIDLDVPGPPVEISESGLIQAGISAIGSLISGGPSATVQSPPAAKTISVQAKALQSQSKRNRAREGYFKLLGAMQQRALVTVVADMREYFDMLIERISKPRATGDGTAVKFSVDLRRLHIAESKTVQSPQPTEARGATLKNMGSQSAKEDPNAADKESILHGLLN